MSTLTLKWEAEAKAKAAAAKKTQMFNNKEGSYIITYRILSGQNEGSYLRLLIFQN